ncbi:MAG: TonB-dependent receptor [Sphingobacteriales bacterium]|nr:MAG: TonB-dependent receptor [Sphingobacteriales bacterium]
MRGTFTGFLLLFVCWIATATAQERPLLQTLYKPAFRKGKVASYLADIRRQTGIPVSYASSVLDSNRKVTVFKETTTLEIVFQQLLTGQAIEAAESNGSILLIPRVRPGNAQAIAYRIITGRIREKGSGEVLIGAAVYEPWRRSGVLTNTYGLYQLALPEGESRICLSYVGFKPDTFEVPAAGNFRKDVDLETAGNMDEIKILAKDRGTPGDRMHLRVTESKPQAQSLGSVDPVRDLQLEAGVQSGVPGSSGLIVRGGSPGQNLYLLDGVPLYYVDHFFGLTSVYNGDALKSVDFYKSAFPAKYGGRISSVIDAQGRDGDLQRMGGEASLGLLRAALTLEGPVLKDKMSFLVSGRRSWIDGLLRAVPEAPTAYFYDINGKLQWLINDNHRLYVGFYTGRDQLLSVGNDSPGYYQRLRWNNTVGSVRWNAILSPRLLMDATATYSFFQFDQRDQVHETDSSGMLQTSFLLGTSAIREAALATQFQWSPGLQYRAIAGIRLARTEFLPSALDRQLPNRIIGATGGVSSLFNTTELSGYAENAIRIGERWSFRPGVHIAAWLSGTFQYLSIQPRFYLAYRRTPWETWYASFNRMGQFLHLLSNNSFGLANDFWVPSTARIRPEESWNVNLGVKKEMNKHWEGRLEGYYKYIDGVISYVTGQNLFDNSDRWQDKITQGIGWSYGTELTSTFNHGDWSARMAYALSWNWRQFSALNGGAAFPYRYDRRHNLNLRLTYTPNHRFDATVQWMYMTGEAFTLPDQVYPDLDNNLNIYNPQGGILTPNGYTYNYAAWNAQRLPAVHRLDIGANFTRRRGLTYVRTWSMGIYNAYARPNVNFVSLRENANGSVSLQGTALLQFMPYVALKIKF